MDNIQYNPDSLETSTATTILRKLPHRIKLLPPGIQEQMNERFQMNKITDLNEFNVQNNKSQYRKIAQDSTTMINLLQENPVFSDKDLLDLNTIMKHFSVQISKDELKESGVLENAEINTLNLIRYLHERHPQVLRILGIQGILDSACVDYIFSVTYREIRAMTDNSVASQDLHKIEATLDNKLIGFQSLLKYINTNAYRFRFIHPPVKLLRDKPECIAPWINVYSVEQLRDPDNKIMVLAHRLQSTPELISQHLIHCALHHAITVIRNDSQGERTTKERIEQLNMILEMGIDNPKIHTETRISLENTVRQMKSMKERYHKEDRAQAIEHNFRVLQLHLEREKRANRKNRRCF